MSSLTIQERVLEVLREGDSFSTTEIYQKDQGIESLAQVSRALSALRKGGKVFISSFGDRPKRYAIVSQDTPPEKVAPSAAKKAEPSHSADATPTDDEGSVGVVTSNNTERAWNRFQSMLRPTDPAAVESSAGAGDALSPESKAFLKNPTSKTFHEALKASGVSPQVAWDRLCAAMDDDTLDASDEELDGDHVGDVIAQLVHQSEQKANNGQLDARRALLEKKEAAFQAVKTGDINVIERLNHSFEQSTKALHAYLDNLNDPTLAALMDGAAAAQEALDYYEGHHA